MAKKNLLSIVQEILSELDSDEVNSINDTVESAQVANIVQSCFNELISNRNWPHLRQLTKLNSSVDITKPNYLQVPDGTKELENFKYDKHKSTQTQTILRDVTYRTPTDFLEYISSRNSDNANVIKVLDFSGTTLLIFNNYAPQFWTSFDDQWIVTDSYDAAVETTLQSVKTQCIAYIEPLWVHTDEAIPDLPEEAFAALIEESKSTAFVVIKQMANQKAEQKSVRQQKWLSRKAWKVAGGIEYPNYGRSARKGRG